ncbi:ABC transporter ATP-binding protein [Plantibacter sp. Leaf314]|uniref:ABC transporter ATP-binding protein n=1 Tax=Plantibacter sp. Leaf314 TaxID=1736333 RepID=UPI0006FB574A|nr:ABC transporter ATP-binding protein [Plantibacter sp. Leaf314]KQQ50548.1 ABC transporter [Plantibacter sp. Leaf314]
MSMESAAWSSLYKISSARDGKHGFSRESVMRILTFAVPYRSKLVIFITLSIGGAFLAVATPVLAGKVVDVIVARGAVTTIVWLAAVIALVALADAAVSLVTRWFSARIGEGVILDLRTAVFNHVQKMPIAFFTRTRTGALVSRLNNDVIGAQQAFSGTLSGVVTNIVALILTLTVMLSTSWLVTVLAVIMLPIFLIPARRMGRRLAALRREAADHNSAMSTQMTERFSAPGATLVKLFGRPDEEAEEFRVRAARVRDIGVRTAMLQFVFVTALMLVSALALALVYGLGGTLALAGQLDTGEVVTLALLLTRLYVPLTGLANARVEIMSAVVSFERVFEVLDLKPLIQEKPDAVTFPEGPASVEFDDVRFAYPSADKVSLASLEEVSTLDTRGGDEVLHGISFRIEPGQTVAIVGTSGAGKSTIAQLLSRLYDVDSGAVRIGGTDVRDVSFASMRHTLGMVTQDGHLFHETILANLRLARPEASDDEVWDAVRRARLEPLIRSLPDQLDTMVGERGYRLSGGERQRMTIARLLLAQPRVVILDEATAALDSTSEAAVQAALSEALEGRTAMVIAHRLSTIRSADLILVVEDGSIVERGTHDELLALSGRYEELHRTQFAENAALPAGEEALNGPASGGYPQRRPVG